MSEEYTADILEPMLFTVRNDYAFKKIFGSELNKDILTEFVCTVTGMNSQDFDELHLENTEQGKNFTIPKWAVLMLRSA